MKSDKEIRTVVKNIFGTKNARVTKNGEVHVKGKIPDSDKHGWYLLGFTGQPELEDKLFYPDGSPRKGI